MGSYLSSRRCHPEIPIIIERAVVAALHRFATFVGFCNLNARTRNWECCQHGRIVTSPIHQGTKCREANLLFQIVHLQGWHGEFQVACLPPRDGLSCRLAVQLECHHTHRQPVHKQRIPGKEGGSNTKQFYSCKQCMQCDVKPGSDRSYFLCRKFHLYDLTSCFSIIFHFRGYHEKIVVGRENRTFRPKQTINNFCEGLYRLHDFLWGVTEDRCRKISLTDTRTKYACHFLFSSHKKPMPFILALKTFSTDVCFRKCFQISRSLLATNRSVPWALSKMAAVLYRGRSLRSRRLKGECEDRLSEQNDLSRAWFRVVFVMKCVKFVCLLFQLDRKTVKSLLLWTTTKVGQILGSLSLQKNKIIIIVIIIIINKYIDLNKF